jgi:hypothetical protein
MAMLTKKQQCDTIYSVITKGKETPPKKRSNLYGINQKDAQSDGH